MKLIVLSLAILAFASSAVHAQVDAEYDIATDEFLADDFTDIMLATGTACSCPLGNTITRKVKSAAEALKIMQGCPANMDVSKLGCGKAYRACPGGAPNIAHFGNSIRSLGGTLHGPGNLVGNWDYPSMWSDAKRLRAWNDLKTALETKLGQPSKSCSASARPTATCGMHANTVYIFCKGKPVKKWGIGPEGATRAKGNCNYAYRHSNNKKRWNFCKGEEEADVEAEADTQEDVEAGRTLRINMAKWHCGHRKGEKAGNCKGHDCRWQCDRGHRGSAWCGSFKWNQRSRLCTLKSAPMPLCKYNARARTVYIYCRGKPVKKWGIGPEGRSRATGNCNYAYRHRSQQKRWIKFCKGK
jgi:hypothetical protein